MNSSVPTEWITDELARFCDIVGGGTPDRAVHEYWGGKIPWVSPTEVTSLVSKYISKTKEGLTQLGLDKSSAKLHPPGTLLMTSRASIGYVAINTVPMATNQGFQSLRCKDGALADYMYQYITWVRPELERLSAGSTFSEISSVNVKRLRVRLPPLPEQQKIATILSSVDEVIEKTRAQIDKLKDLKTGMMQELLTKGIGHTEFKDSPVGRIPADWKALRVSEFLVERKQKGTGDLPIYSVLMNGGMVPRSTVERRVPSALETSDNRLVRKGDLAYNMMRMWQGASGVAPVDCLVSPAYVVCTPSENIDSCFLGYLMKNPSSIQILKQYSQGLTGDRLRLYFDSFKQIILPIPPIAEQRKIALALNATDSVIREKISQLAAREKFKKAIMQDLLTGKVRVNLNESTVI